jgi:hypothetical protein
MRNKINFIGFLFSALVVTTCAEPPSEIIDAGGDSDSDSDSDDDSDSDSDSDGDGDSDGDTDSDSDSDSDSDTDGDSDTDCDSDADGDSDTDGDSDEIGDCSGPEDCEEGSCEQVPDEPGGYWTCIAPVEPANGPSINPGKDECTNSDECDPGCGCYYVEQFMGPVIVYNACICDECESDEDCDYPQDQICLPGGAFGNPKNSCFYTECKVHSDCAQGEEGACIPYLDKCWGIDTPRFAGKYCHYADDECWYDEDCPSEDLTCMPGFDGSGFFCDVLVCPA